MLEVSLAQHPHLLPLLYDIKVMLNTPGVDVAQVAPKIAALTSALQAAMAQQAQQPPQQHQQHRQTPSPQPTLQQPPPVGSVLREMHLRLPPDSMRSMFETITYFSVLSIVHPFFP